MNATIRQAKTGRRRAMLYCINYAPEMIGVGRYAGELGAHLAAVGVEVEVVTTPPHYPGWAVPPHFANRYGTERLNGARVFRCPMWLSTKMSGLARLLAPLSFAFSSAPVAIVRALIHRPHVVVATEPGLFTAPAALLAARLCGARAVLHVQDLEVEAAFAVSHLKGRWAKVLARAFERVLLRRFDDVVTISNRIRAALLAAGAQADHTTVIRNWVDLSVIRPLDRPSAFRTELALRPGCRVVLYAGNIGAKQALDLVMDAADTLLNRQDVVFVIAGEGPEKSRLMARAKGNVKFLPLQPEHRLCELLSLADLHILPQHAGAADLVLPSKLAAMLASGRPILVQAAEGTELAEFLDGAARIVPPGDVSALANAILTFSPDTAREAEQRRMLASKLSHEDALRDFFDLLFPKNSSPSRFTPTVVFNNPRQSFAMSFSVCNFCLDEKTSYEFTAREMMMSSGDEFIYIECKSCGALRLKNIPHEMASYYAGGYYSFIAPDRTRIYNSMLELYDRISFDVGRAPLLMPISASGASVFQALRTIKAKRSSHILDVGCGAGVLLRRLEAAGFTNLSGIDAYLPNPIRTSAIDIRVGELTAMTGSFDVIMFNHSLEHVARPIEVLQAAAQLLAPSASIIVRVPLAGNYAWRKYNENWVQLDAPRHLNIPTSAGMAKAAALAGLAVHQVIYDSSDFQFTGSERYLARSEGRPEDDAPAPTRRRWRRLAARLNSAADGDQAAFILRAVVKY